MARPNPIKEPKTFNEQMEILKRRGLYVADEAAAVEVLRRVNYYRLSAYWLTYHKCDKFNATASFEKAYGIYEFDRQFRGILLEPFLVFRTPLHVRSLDFLSFAN